MSNSIKLFSTVKVASLFFFTISATCKYGLLIIIFEDVPTEVWKPSYEHVQQKPVKKKKAKLLSLLDLARDGECFFCLNCEHKNISLVTSSMCAGISFLFLFFILLHY